MTGVYFFKMKNLIKNFVINNLTGDYGSGLLGNEDRDFFNYQELKDFEGKHEDEKKKTSK